MKKLILLTALIFAVSLGMAQRGNNSYHNPRGGNSGYNYGNNHGPPAAMHPQDFQRAKVSVNRQNFEQDRLRVAKQIVRTNNLRSVQVKQLVGLMSFESSRLKLAKVGYSSVIDPDRYYLVNEAFRFSSSVRELDRHIASAGAPQYGNVAYGGGHSSTTVYSSGQHGSTTYSGGVTATSGHGGHGGGMGINHGAANAGPPACGMCQGHHAANHFCDMEFGRILRSVKKQCFDRDKLMVAKQALGDKMLNVDMVVRVMNLLSFERSKLEFAKFAYQNTWDQGGYYIVNDAFSFSSSIRELNQYIRYNG